MEMKRLTRQLWAGALVLSLGMTSAFSNIHAVDGSTDSNKDWEKVEDFKQNLKKDTDATTPTVEYDEDEDVRVMIVFEGNSVLETSSAVPEFARSYYESNYADKLEAQQERIVDEISDEVLDGAELDVRYSFTLFTNAVSANVTYKDIEEINQIDGVKNVYVMPRYEAQAADTNTYTSGEMIGSHKTWQSGYTGAGMRVAVIDTGLDTDHPSYNEDAYLYALEEQAAKEKTTVAAYDLLDKAEISGVLDKLNASAFGGVTADSVYLSSKVPFAVNYVDEGLDVTHDNDTQGDHGSHVAGIAVSNKYVKTANGYETQANGVSGVAPNAQLIVMKVFGQNGGAYTDDYMAAIQDALLLGADSINLSLGSIAGESKEYDSSEKYVNTIFESLSKTDTVVTISAGNAGAWSDNTVEGALLAEDVNLHTAGSPGTYTNSLTVASADNNGFTGYGITIGNVSVGYNDAYERASFTTLDTTGSGTDYDYVFMDGVGKAEDYNGLDVRGKIVVVSRGEISFAEKHTNAGNAGAAGVLVYNNTMGTISMSLEGSTATIPCASITQADAARIKAASTQSGDVYVGTMNINSVVMTTFDEEARVNMSDFSSWGVPGDLSLKPEITSVGGNVYSTLTNGQYGLMSGTSMSSPSMAGMSALVIEYIEKNNLAEKTGLSVRALAQSLLMSTATPLVEADGEYYSPRKQGAGLGNAYYATTSPAYILMANNGTDGKVKAELGDDPERTGVYSFGFTIYNLTDQTLYYALDGKALTEELQEGYITGTSHALSADFECSQADFLYDLNEDGVVDKNDALTLLQHVNESIDSEIIRMHESYYDFNNNGILDTQDVHILLNMIKNDDADLQLIKVDDKTDINVTITLSDADKAYLNDSFENGMYVDGFVTLEGDFDLSIPFLAFYGNWSDASMFEHIDFVDQSADAYSYTGEMNTNFFSLIRGGQNEVVYTPNPYVDDAAYLSDRNAVSSESGDVIGTVYYSLIRNAADVKVTVTDAKNGTVYYTNDDGAHQGAFYHDNRATWMNTRDYTDINWEMTDANGQPLPEGTKVNVTLTALPAYYDNGSHPVGEGASITLPLTIDNTAPVAYEPVVGTDGKTQLTVQDNEYVAAVAVLDKTGENILSLNAVNQTTKGAKTTLTLDIPNTVVMIAVCDYAGNEEYYRYNNTGHDDTDITSGVVVTPANVQVGVRDSVQLNAAVQPDWISEAADGVTWSSSDQTIATVDANGVVTGIKEGTVIITATSKAVNASGSHETGTCAVEVVPYDQKLTALVRTASTMYWGNLSASAPANNVKYRDASAAFISATDFGNGVYAADASGSIYVLSKDLSSTQLFGTLSGAQMTDLAVGPVTGYLAATYGPYLLLIDMNSGSVGQLNLTSKIGQGVYINAITYVGLTRLDNNGLIGEAYAYTTTDGGLYYIYLALNEDEDIYLSNKVIDLGTNLNMAYNSLYYNLDLGYLTWAAFDGTKTTLYRIDDYADVPTAEKVSESTDKIYGLINLRGGAASGASANAVKEKMVDTSTLTKVESSASTVEFNKVYEGVIGK